MLKEKGVLNMRRFNNKDIYIYRRVLSIFLIVILGTLLCLPLSVSARTVMMKNEIATAEVPSSMGTEIIRGAIAAMNFQIQDNYSETYDNQIIYDKRGNSMLVGKLEGLTFIIYEDFLKMKEKDQIKALNAFMAYIYNHVETMSNTDNRKLAQNNAEEFFKDLQGSSPELARIMMPAVLGEVKGNLWAGYNLVDKLKVTNILGFILGLVSVFLIMLLVFSTVIDLIYMGVPSLREKVIKSCGGGDGKSVYTDLDDHTVLETIFNFMGVSGGGCPYVSYEAKSTIMETERNFDEYNNAYLKYFKRRFVTYIVIATCIMYLVCGGISGIIAFIFRLVSGFNA